MISITRGTKSWSDAPQQQSMGQDSTQTLSATDREKVLGDKNIGEILNKVADPNWVDPAKMRGVGNNKLDKDAFLKLLLAQLKNQDPTTPMKSHEMAAQLAQFSSLEKLNNINDSIGGLARAQEPSAKYETLNLLGKAVVGDSSQVVRNHDDEAHTIKYNLAGDARDVKVAIKNGNGEVVRELDFADIAKGKNEFHWNGRDEDGRVMPVGEYKVDIEATASNGHKIHAQTQFEGIISGVNFTPKGPVLMVGQQSVRLSDVSKIMDPTQLELERAKQQAANAQGLKPATSAKAAPTGTNLDSVAMSGDMLNRLKKEVGTGN